MNKLTIQNLPSSTKGCNSKAINRRSFFAAFITHHLIRKQILAYRFNYIVIACIVTIVKMCLLNVRTFPSNDFALIVHKHKHFPVCFVPLFRPTDCMSRADNKHRPSFDSFNFNG